MGSATPCSSSSPGQFVHAPLDLTQASIRLLQILPGSSRDGIECTLENVPRDKYEYVCLSYTWGDPYPSHDILVNGKTLQIRSNHYDFLRIARKLKTKDRLWIDAVCIDQANARERNHQVQQMAQIYRGALHVLVYPGRLSRRLKLATQLTLPALYSRWSAIYWHWIPVILYIFKPTVMQTHRLSYWSRAWIVQELLLARSCRLISQAGIIEWRSFEPLYETGMHLELKGRLTALEGFCDPENGASQYYSGAKANFEELVKTFCPTGPGLDRSRCADPRDTIYSLLGLAKDAEGFTVDYQTTVASLFLDTVQHFEMELLGFATDVLARHLKIGMQCYCSECAPRVLGQRVEYPNGFGGNDLFKLLVMADWPFTPDASAVSQDDCPSCREMNFVLSLGPGIDLHWRREHPGGPILTRVAPDKMCLFFKAEEFTR